jgi:hypothetical protein
VEDFDELKRKDINVTGKIVLMRYGRAFRGDKVSCKIRETIKYLQAYIYFHYICDYGSKCENYMFLSMHFVVIFNSKCKVLVQLYTTTLICLWVSAYAAARPAEDLVDSLTTEVF